MAGTNNYNAILDTPIASGASITSAFMTHGFNICSIDLPLFTSGLASATAAIYVYGCDTASGTFRRMVYETEEWLYSGLGNVCVVCQGLTAFKYAKIESTISAITGGYSMRINCRV